MPEVASKRGNGNFRNTDTKVTKNIMDTVYREVRVLQ